MVHRSTRGLCDDGEDEAVEETTEGRRRREGQGLWYGVRLAHFTKLVRARRRQPLIVQQTWHGSGSTSIRRNTYGVSADAQKSRTPRLCQANGRKQVSIVAVYSTCYHDSALLRAYMY